MQASRLRLLGDFSLETPFSGGPVRVGRKAQALLALAAMHGTSGAGRSQFVALLWPDHSDEDARSALRQCLHLLRRALGDAAAGLDSDGDRIVLRPSAFDVDLRRFEALAKRRDMEAMLAAANLYRGDFLQSLDVGNEFEHWAGAERERLRDLAQGLLVRMSECAEGAAACDATVQLAHRLLASDPVHEGCYRALMRLHARAGLRGKALQLWDECRTVLRRELGVAPSAQTFALVDELRAGAGGAARAEPPASGGPIVSPARSAEDTAVVDLLLRGWQFFTLMTAESMVKARESYEAAVALAPGNAEAIAKVGWTHWIDSLSGWVADPSESFEKAHECASRAIACSPGLMLPHALMGKVLLWRMEHEAALEQLHMAVELGPQAAYAHFHLGDAAMWCGRLDESLAHVGRALALDPNDHGMFLTIRGYALWLAGRHHDAQAAFTSAITRNPAYLWPHNGMTAVHYELGDLRSARDAVVTACSLNRRISLSFVRDVLPFRVPEHRARLLAACEAAGMRAQEVPMGEAAG
ncbi:MAG: BTAD domain-containing putative transcriptional regulator [Ramlibacter sp.]|nr:BTAD domain-containing putative transcriptional regulator [Ramlibacter sp.]